MLLEPPTREPRYLIERPRFFEEMSRSRNDDELLFAGQLCERRAVELNDLDIIPAHDEERRLARALGIDAASDGDVERVGIGEENAPHARIYPEPA